VEEVVAVMAGAVRDFGVVHDLVQLRPAKGITQLIEENGQPVRQLRLRGERGASQRHPRSRPREDLVPIHCKELAEHAWNLSRT
jgi:hypothetical protein